MSEGRTTKRSRTDWAKVDYEDIDHNDSPPIEDDFWTEAVRIPGSKQQITLRLDRDVVSFFRNQGRGYQTAINTVLRRYVEAQQHAPAKGGTAPHT